MLTDDDLIRELETAFRADTAGLRYSGKVPAPRTSVVPWTAVPIAAATAAVVVLPQLGGGPGAQYAGPSPAPAPSASVAPVPPAVAQVPEPELVTEEIELAGMSVSYRHPAGTTPPSVMLFLGVQPPADAQEVDLSGSPEGRWLAQAWVGTSPEIGKAGLFVRTRESDLGEYALFAADEITVEDWTRMIQTGSNR